MPESVFGTRHAKMYNEDKWWESEIVSEKTAIAKILLHRWEIKKKSDILNFKHFQETKLYNYDRLIQGQ